MYIEIFFFVITSVITVLVLPGSHVVFCFQYNILFSYIDFFFSYYTLSACYYYICIAWLCLAALWCFAFQQNIVHIAFLTIAHIEKQVLSLKFTPWTLSSGA